MREMNELSFGQNQRSAQIRVLGTRGERFELASIFAAVGKADPRVGRPISRSGAALSVLSENVYEDNIHS